MVGKSISGDNVVWLAMRKNNLRGQTFAFSL